MDGESRPSNFFGHGLRKFQIPSVQCPGKLPASSSNSGPTRRLFLELGIFLELGCLELFVFRVQLKPVAGVCSFATNYESDWNNVFIGDGCDVKCQCIGGATVSL